MRADHQIDVVSEIAELREAIDRAAAATQLMLADRPPTSANDDPRAAPAEHKELRRQLAALRERVGLAERGSEDPRALRAELATLLFFARTLQADADEWCSAREPAIEELDRDRTGARQQNETLAAERETLAARRDALQSTILQTAARMAQQNRGECRRTVPVFTLAEGLTVCSVSVSCPRRGLRPAQRWLVTLSRWHDVLVRPE